MSADEMPAGRELDALVAERVMGADVSIAPMHTWELNADGTIDTVAWDSDYHNGPRCARCGYSFCHHCEKEDAYTAVPCQIESPPYSTDIAAAWQVVERMRALGWYSTHTDLTLDAGREWWAWHFIKHTAPGGPDVRGMASTAPLAICRAALKALEAK